MVAVHRWTSAGLGLVLLLSVTSSAEADVTLSGGVASSPARPTAGVSVGVCRGPLCGEFEVSHVFGNHGGAPAVVLLGPVGLVRAPLPPGRTSLYGVVGYGFYDEMGSTTMPTKTGAGGHRNVGVTGRVQVRGPLSLRADYRLFFLSDSDGARPMAPRIHRVSGGLSIAF